MKRKTWIAIGVAAVVLAASGIGGAMLLSPEWLENEHRKSARHDHAPPGESLALEEVLRKAATYVPGEVVKVEVENHHGRRVYELKVIAANGRVRELTLDGHDGHLIEIEED